MVEPCPDYGTLSQEWKLDIVPRGRMMAQIWRQNFCRESQNAQKIPCEVNFHFVRMI